MCGFDTMEGGQRETQRMVRVTRRRKEPPAEPAEDDSLDREPQQQQEEDVQRTNNNIEEVEEDVEEEVEEGDIDDMEFPSNIHEQLQRAVQGADLNIDSAHLIYAEDDEAIKEIEEEIGPLDFGSKTKRRFRRKMMNNKVSTKRDLGGYKLSDAQAEVIGKANISYTMGKFQDAIALIHALIKVAPMAYQAWATLATIYEELGDMDQALPAYLMAAHLSRTDGPLWRRLGALSLKSDLKDQAIYCYTRAIRADKRDVDALWDRAQIYESMQHTQMAIIDLYAIADIIPGHMDVIKKICKLLVSIHETTRAIDLFLDAVREDKKTFTRYQKKLLGEPYVEEDKTSEEPSKKDKGKETATTKEDKEDEPNLEDDESYLRLGYEELNMLADLYFNCSDYKNALEVLTEGLIRAYRWNYMLDYPDNVNDIVDVSVIDLDNLKDIDGTHGRVSELERILGKDHFQKALDDLPVEICVKLGICHLRLYHDLTSDEYENLVGKFIGLVKEIKDSELKDYLDVLYDAIDSLTDAKYYVQALHILSRLNSNDETDDGNTWKRMAICYNKLGHYDTAVVLYKAVIESFPEDNDSKIALAEIYHEFGDEKETDKWLNQVTGLDQHMMSGMFAETDIDKRLSILAELSRGGTGEELLADAGIVPRQSRHKNLNAEVDSDNDENDASKNKGKKGGMITHTIAVQQKRSERALRAAADEKSKIEENRIMYDKLIKLYEEKNDFISRAKYIRYGRVLISRFARHKPLFPKDKSSVIKERRTLLPIRHNKADGGGHSNVLDPRSIMANERDGEENDDEEDDGDSESDTEYHLEPNRFPSHSSNVDNGILKPSSWKLSEGGNSARGESSTSWLESRPVSTKPVKTSFQGLTFDEWYKIFIQFSVVAVMSDQEEAAANALMTAAASSVYHRDEKRRITLRLQMLAAATYGGNISRVNDICRWFCQYAVFTNDTYRLFSTMQSGGVEVVQCYAMASNIKYFFRQIKQMIRNIQMDPDDNTRQSALLLCTYGHMLQAGRSYLQAIGYFMKAYDMVPNDPLVNLSLGISHLHRSMQRKSENRHLHIMQAFTFIFRYRLLRVKAGGIDEDTSVEDLETMGSNALSFGRGLMYETLYNIGRSFHHLGLYNLAIEYYEKVLALHDEDEMSFKKPRPRGAEHGHESKRQLVKDATHYFASRDVFEKYDMAKEAAYNMSLIYVSIGSPFLAQILIRKYCTI